MNPPPIPEVRPTIFAQCPATSSPSFLTFSARSHFALGDHHRADKWSVRANTGLICSFATWQGRRHIASYGWTGISYLAHSEWHGREEGRKEAVSPGWHLFALSAVKKLFVGNELIHRSSRSLIAANLCSMIWDFTSKSQYQYMSDSIGSKLYSSLSSSIHQS